MGASMVVVDRGSSREGGSERCKKSGLGWVGEKIGRMGGWNGWVEWGGEMDGWNEWVERMGGMDG